MKEVWESIESKLKEIAPDVLASLNKGVTDVEVEKLEKSINAKLPTEFVEFYRIHNGQLSQRPGLIGCEELLSFERIMDEWQGWKTFIDSNEIENENASLPDIGIKNNWWNSLWIPITQDGSGDHYCIDLDPAEKGSCGQIIRMRHDDPQRHLEANSFREWITNYKDKLLSGQMVYSEDYFGIIDKDFITEP